MSDALDQLSRKPWVMAPPLQLVLGQRIFGTAVTVLVAVTGEKAHHKVGATVIDQSPPGTVIVAAASPTLAPCSVNWKSRWRRLRGLGGLVTDCAIRTRALQAGGDGAPTGIEWVSRQRTQRGRRLRPLEDDGARPKLSCGGCAGQHRRLGDR